MYNGLSHWHDIFSGIRMMSTTIAAPAEWVETIGDLRLPAKTDTRLQQLMDRNNEGELSPPEREELRPWWN
jgi:hypothetical protein